MTSDFDEVSRLRQEAFSVRRLLSAREEEAKSLTFEITLLTPVYKQIEAGEDVDLKKLSEQGVVLAQPSSSLEKLVAKSKIGGMIAQKTDALHKVENEVGNLKTILNQLSTCPRCSGTGTNTRLRYEREDSQIRAGETVDECTLCDGRGIIDLS